LKFGDGHDLSHVSQSKLGLVTHVRVQEFASCINASGMPLTDGSQDIVLLNGVVDNVVESNVVHSNLRQVVDASVVGRRVDKRDRGAVEIALSVHRIDKSLSSALQAGHSVLVGKRISFARQADVSIGKTARTTRTSSTVIHARHHRRSSVGTFAACRRTSKSHKSGDGHSVDEDSVAAADIVGVLHVSPSQVPSVIRRSIKGSQGSSKGLDLSRVAISGTIKGANDHSVHRQDEFVSGFAGQRVVDRDVAAVVSRDRHLHPGHGTGSMSNSRVDVLRGQSPLAAVASDAVASRLEDDAGDLWPLTPVLNVDSSVIGNGSHLTGGAVGDISSGTRRSGGAVLASRSVLEFSGATSGHLARLSPRSWQNAGVGIGAGNGLDESIGHSLLTVDTWREIISVIGSVQSGTLSLDLTSDCSGIARFAFVARNAFGSTGSGSVGAGGTGNALVGSSLVLVVTKGTLFTLCKSIGRSHDLDPIDRSLIQTSADASILKVLPLDGVDSSRQRVVGNAVLVTSV